MATLQLRVDDSLKAKADALFSSLGLDTSTAVRIFLAAIGVQRFRKRGKTGGIGAARIDVSLQYLQ